MDPHCICDFFQFFKGFNRITKFETNLEPPPVAFYPCERVAACLVIRVPKTCPGRSRLKILGEPFCSLEIMSGVILSASNGNARLSPFP
jgi:hypothetical protein